MRISKYAVLVVLVLVSATPVLAQSYCAPRSELVETLKNEWAEVQVFYGLMNANDRLLEVFASPGGKTWTILASSPGGDSCVVTSGHYWSEVAPQLLKPTGLPI